MTGVNYDYIFR